MLNLVKEELKYWQEQLDKGIYKGVGFYYIRSKIKVLKDLLIKYKRNKGNTIKECIMHRDYDCSNPKCHKCEFYQE